MTSKSNEKKQHQNEEHRQMKIQQQNEDQK